VRYLIVVLLLLPWISGCCLDIEENQRLGNIITYERGKVCTDSTQRGLSSSAKLCFSRVCKRS